MLSSAASATITLYKINEISLYQAELLSSNGNIFHPYDTHTILTFNVYRGIENVTNNFARIEWVRYSFDSDLYFEDKRWGIEYENKTSITLNKEDVNMKCIIQVNAYINDVYGEVCVASSRITLTNVNELYSSDTPPENPLDGQLWLDTSKETPVIFSWNQISNRWTLVGKTTPFVRNLIQNSNFWKLNDYGFNQEGDSYLRSLIVTENFNKKWLKLESIIPTESLDMTAGVYQNTSYPIEKDSNYVFSFLAYCETVDPFLGSNVYVKITSINSNKQSTTLYKRLTKIQDVEYDLVTCNFTTLSDTDIIQVLVGVEPARLCKMYITELCLYNTSNYYPWELSPEDKQEQIDNKLSDDHLSVFNALTKNGALEGIFIDTDEDGNEHYYFNASHLKSGTIDGGLIDGSGLNIKDKDGQSIFHVYEDENGQTHIDMVANNLYIGNKKATTEERLIESITQLESTTNETIRNNIALSEGEMRTEIALSSAETIRDAMSYVDSSIADLSSETKESIQNSINASSEDSNRYSERLTAAMQESIMQAVALEIDRVFNYTDSQLGEINGSITGDLNNSKEELNNKIDGDISTLESSIIEYIDSIKTSLQNHINTKADREDVISSNTATTALQNDLKNLSSAVSQKATKTEVQDLNNDLTELSNEVSDSITEMQETIKTLQDVIAELQKKVDELQEKIETPTPDPEEPETPEPEPTPEPEEPTPEPEPEEPNTDGTSPDDPEQPEE